MDQKTLENKIIGFKDKIRTAENQKNNIIGALGSLDDQLKKLLNCDKIEDIDKKIEAINKNVESIDKELILGINELEELPEFNSNFNEDVD